MPLYTHVLFATDFSPDSDKAGARAMAIAQATGARLTLVHVVEYSAMEYAGEIPIPENIDLDQRRIDAARDVIAALAGRLGVPGASTRVELGSPKHEVVRVATELGADLIVVGSHGKHGLQLLLGSTANGILHLAPCDVLAVRV
ncbi:MAG: universal stress protein [Gammaproteobacteria bacterium]|jgi:universal stress protein A|nr:universal stress protein [Gammaproteobacteria bacterium]